MFIFFMIVILLVIIGILFWQLENAIDRLYDVEREARFYKRRYEDIRSELWCLDSYNLLRKEKEWYDEHRDEQD